MKHVMIAAHDVLLNKTKLVDGMQKLRDDLLVLRIRHEFIVSDANTTAHRLVLALEWWWS